MTSARLGVLNPISWQPITMQTRADGGEMQRSGAELKDVFMVKSALEVVP